jgi:hypothetical protein
MSPKTGERNRLPPLSETEKREALAKGVREFNSWRFYDCHETLEDVWRAEAGDLADFFQGVIKVAAAFHHLLRGNHKARSASQPRPHPPGAVSDHPASGISVQRL